MPKPDIVPNATTIAMMRALNDEQRTMLKVAYLLDRDQLRAYPRDATASMHNAPGLQDVLSGGVTYGECLAFVENRLALIQQIEQEAQPHARKNYRRH